MLHRVLLLQLVAGTAAHRAIVVDNNHFGAPHGVGSATARVETLADAADALVCFILSICGALQYTRTCSDSKYIYRKNMIK